MRVTLDLDDDIVRAARERATAERRPLGSVVSELARRGLMTMQAGIADDPTVIRAPAGSPPLTPERRRSAHKLFRVALASICTAKATRINPCDDAELLLHA